jgi:ABC-type Fe3+/spermidine/putrescine transport system ATPase subunit
LLLDEPLSSLDTSLKDDLKRLLRNLNKGGQTIIHVTHDYGDAISLAKRVGVIHNGRIIQEGSVDEVFRNPSNRFVARYAGIRNFFRVEISGEKGNLMGVTKHNITFKLEGEKTCLDCLIIIKSDSISLTRRMPEDKKLNIIKGTISEIIPSEFGMELTLDTGDLFYVNMLIPEFETQRFAEGEEAWMSFPTKAIIALNGIV